MLKPVSKVCPYCSKNIDINLDDFIVDSRKVAERGMGCEIEHTIECDEFICPYCSKPMSINGEVYEYPQGDIEVDNSQVEPTLNQ